MPFGTISQPPANPGREYVKTKGHYHLKNPAGIGYPERYEVIEGVAHVLLQKKTLDHIALVKATKGDIVLIPRGYGHVTINPSREETLMMANLVSAAFVSEYAEYELIDNTLVRDPHYPEVTVVHEIKCQTAPLCLLRRWSRAVLKKRAG